MLLIKKEKYALIIDFVFAVSGAAASGKTAFCKNLERYLNDRQINTVHIPLDGFLLDRKTRRGRKLSGYNPESTDMPFLIETMKKLIYDGREINLPLYDHNTGKHSGFKLIGPGQVIILDGITSLHYEIRERFTNFNIFLYSDDLVMRGLRLLGDMEERGYSVFETLPIFFYVRAITSILTPMPAGGYYYIYLRPLKNTQFCSSSRKAIRLRRINRRNILNISRIKI